MFRQTLRDSSYESSEQAVDESEDRMFRHAERQMWQICEGNVEMLRTHFRNTVSRDKYSDQQVDEFVAVVADRCRTWFAEHGDDRPEGPSASQSDVSGNNDDSSVVAASDVKADDMAIVQGRPGGNDTPPPSPYNRWMSRFGAAVIVLVIARMVHQLK